MADIHFTSAVELAARVRRGALSPVEVVEAFLDRIDRRDDAINAYVTVTADRAREAAREAERALRAGERIGPLHGVPVAIKDLENVAGVRTTFGSVPYGENVAEENEPFVDRLLDAGAIVLGKTNTPEFGHKGTTDNLLFGPTSTPFEIGRNAGGSSGGSAAAVAAGLVPIAQGSDGGGSVRIPSSFCGVYGLKPTYRRIEREHRPDGFSHTPFSQLGPHARSVEDAALMLDVMAGPGPSDPMVAPDDGADYLGATRRGIDGLSIAYSPDLDVFPIDDRVAGVVEEAAYAFEDAGASVEEVTLGVEHTREEIEGSWMTGFEVGYAKTAAIALEDDGIDYLGDDRDRTTPELVGMMENGRGYSAVEYKRQDVIRTDFFETIQGVLGEYDLIASPTLAVPPVENVEEGSTLGPSEINGEAVDPHVGWCLTYPFNMTGHPVASIPAGLADGLPIGLQLVGRRWADETVLAASAAFERVRPWADNYPRAPA